MTITMSAHHKARRFRPAERSRLETCRVHTPVEESTEKKACFSSNRVSNHSDMDNLSGSNEWANNAKKTKHANKDGNTRKLKWPWVALCLGYELLDFAGFCIYACVALCLGFWRHSAWDASRPDLNSIKHTMIKVLRLRGILVTSSACDGIVDNKHQLLIKI